MFGLNAFMIYPRLDRVSNKAFGLKPVTPLPPATGTGLKPTTFFISIELLAELIDDWKFKELLSEPTVSINLE